MKKCHACQARRSRLYTCVTCGKKLCGCCSFKSRVGRVCTGMCHRAALAKHNEATRKRQRRAGGLTP